MFQIDGVTKGSWVPGFLKFGGTPHKTPPNTPTRRSTIGGPVKQGADTVSAE